MIRDSVELISRNATNEVVDHRVVDMQTWYDGTTPLIDSEAYRRSREISVIDGREFDAAGALVATWRNYYGPDGTLVGGEQTATGYRVRRFSVDAERRLIWQGDMQRDDPADDGAATGKVTCQLHMNFD